MRNRTILIGFGIIIMFALNALVAHWEYTEARAGQCEASERGCE